MLTDKEWDRELWYCVRLVRNQGNISVPRDMVASYLAVQAVAANKDHATNLAVAFAGASELVKMGSWKNAETTLATLWLTA